MTTETKEIVKTENEETKKIIMPTELSPEAREYNRQMKIAHTLSKSNIVPAHFRGKPEDVFACVMYGSELGMKPMMALNSIVMIQGNATMKAQTMMAVVRAKCPTAIFTIKVDEDKKIVSVRAQRDKDDLGYEAIWDMEKAKAMGLSHKDNYIKQPTTMLRWRASSEACRMVFSDLLMGIYATEELEHLQVNQTEKTRAAEATETFLRIQND